MLPDSIVLWHLFHALSLFEYSTVARTWEDMLRTYGLWWNAKHLDVHTTRYLLIGYQAHADLLRDIHVEP